MSKYKRPFSVNYRKPVILESSDPRYKNLERYRSRLGRKVIVKELNEQKVLENIEEVNLKYLAIGTEYNKKLNHTLIDSQENMIFIGQDNISVGTGNPAQIVKFSKSGNFVWQTQVNPSGTGANIKNATIDSSNNIYLISTTYTTTSGVNTYRNVYISKYSEHGTKIWSKNISTLKQGITTDFEPSNIQFSPDYTKMYIGISRIRRNSFPPFDRWFYIYEINTSSGNIIRSKKYYAQETTDFSPYYATIAIEERTMSICYANDNLYIFGRQNGYTSTPKKYLVVLKLSISSFEITDSLSIEDSAMQNAIETSQCDESACYAYNYFDSISNKIYFAPSINFEGIFYELDLSQFNISRRTTIGLNLFNGSSPRVNIVGIYKDDNDDILLLGHRFVNNNDPAPFNGTYTFSFILRYNELNQTRKYFNFFRVTSSQTNITPSFSIDGFFSKFSKILISTDIVLTTNDNPTLNRGSFAFRIPINPGTYRTDLKIDGPQIHSSTKFQMSDYTNTSVSTSGLVQELGVQYDDYIDDNTYSDFVYADSLDTTAFPYNITKF